MHGTGSFVDLMMGPTVPTLNKSCESIAHNDGSPPKRAFTLLCRNFRSNYRFGFELGVRKAALV